MAHTIPMAHVVTANQQTGHHFFDADAMRFFGSRVGRTAYNGHGGRWFVTSERRGYPFTESARGYSVRKQRADGSVWTVEAGDYALTWLAVRRHAVRLAHQLADGVACLPHNYPTVPDADR